MNHPFPEAFLSNMQKLLGDEYPAFLRALDQPPALALRLNPKRHGAEAAAAPTTPQSAPGMVKVSPSSVICRVG